jgi:endonuclease/exonuclease/phosphatase family metal-dependent hydrolase
VTHQHALDVLRFLGQNRAVRVISWNMGMGPSRRPVPGLHDQAWHYLLGLGPDLAFVQEALPPAWVRSEGNLIQGPVKRWGSAIFSPRYPLERYRLAPSSNLRALGSYLALGIASLPDGNDAFVASVHARDGEATPDQLGQLDPAVAKRRSVPRPHVNDVVFLGLAELVAERFILAGDWNTGRSQASKKAGAEFFDRVSERDWYDCVWERKGELQTWFGPARHLKQDDHVFCDRRLGQQPGDVWVAKDAATPLGLSDHAPLVLDFEVGSIAMSSLAVEREDDTVTKTPKE